jgi:ribosome maturation factor RimP
MFSKSGPRCPLFAFWGAVVPEQSRKQEIEAKAAELVEPVLAGLGLELWDIEYLHEREGWVLRLLIDKPGGVSLEDCAAGSRAVDTLLDVEDVVPHQYHLQVSSPGLERPLKKPDHFRKAEGKKVKLKTFRPLGEPPRRKFRGLLTRVADDVITVEVEGAAAFSIPFRDIAKATLDFEFER